MKSSPEVGGAKSQIFDHQADASLSHELNGENGWSWPRKVAVLGAIGLTGFGAYWNLSPSDPIEKVPATEEPADPDQKLVALSVNMQNQARSFRGELASLVDKYNPDIINLQETTRADIDHLSKDFPQYNILFALADEDKSKFSGGFGNISLSTGEISDEKVKTIKGTQLSELPQRFTKAFKDELAEKGSDFSEVEAARLEDRAMSSFVTEIELGKETQKIVSINLHIAGNGEVRDEQLIEALDFMEESKGELPVLACGDFNANYYYADSIVYKFAAIGFIVNQTGPTHDSGKTIDYCAVSPGDTEIKVGNTKVVEFPSDHKALVYKLTP